MPCFEANPSDSSIQWYKQQFYKLESLYYDHNDCCIVEFSSISILSLLNLIDTLMKESNIYLQKHNVALFILISIISENR